MEVVRTWRRDGSQNLMGLGNAVANLAGNTNMSATEIRVLLLSGKVLETKLARFELCPTPCAIVPPASQVPKHKDIL